MQSRSARSKTYRSLDVGTSDRLLTPTACYVGGFRPGHLHTKMQEILASDDTLAGEAKGKEA